MALSLITLRPKASDVRIPTAPSNLVATQDVTTHTTVNLTWTDNSSNETGFKVQKSTDNSTWSDVTTTAAGATSLAVTGLTANQFWYFRVQAVPNSSWSNSAGSGTYVTGSRQLYAGDKPHFGVPDNASFSGANQSWAYRTVEWFDNLTGTQGIAGKGTGSAAADFEWKLETVSNVIRFTISDGSTTASISSAAISINTSYYILAYYDADADTINLEVNGVASTPVAWTTGSHNTTAPFEIGRTDGVNYREGRTAKACLWMNRKLTAAEKTWDRKGNRGRHFGELGKAGTDGAALLTGLVGAWMLNESSATANATDSLGANNAIATFGELLVNGTFETAGAGGADVHAGWAESAAGTSTINRDTVDFDSGVASNRFDLDASNSTCQLTQNVLIAGHRYTTTTRAKSSANEPECRIGNNASACQIWIQATSWTTYTIAAFTASSAVYGVRSNPGQASTSIWFDAVSCKALDIPAAAGP